METTKLTNEQKLSIALKQMHETMLLKPIGYNDILSILKQHQVKKYGAIDPIHLIFMQK